MRNVSEETGRALKAKAELQGRHARTTSRGACGAAAASLLDGRELLAPQHLTAEVASVIRGWSLSGQITDEEALKTFREFDYLHVEEVSKMSMLPAVYALRHNISVHDAM